MVWIELRCLDNCSFYERHLISWFDSTTKKIVIIYDHPAVQKDFMKILRHELLHYKFDKLLPENRLIKWLAYPFEEIAIWFLS